MIPLDECVSFSNGRSKDPPTSQPIKKSSTSSGQIIAGPSHDRFSPKWWFSKGNPRKFDQTSSSKSSFCLLYFRNPTPPPPHLPASLPAPWNPKKLTLRESHLHHGNLRVPTPPMPPPQRNRRPYSGTMKTRKNKAGFFRAGYSLGGFHVALGVNGTLRLPVFQQVDTEAADFEANLTSLTQHVQRLNLRTSGGWGGKRNGWIEVMLGCPVGS